MPPRMLLSPRPAVACSSSDRAGLPPAPPPAAVDIVPSVFTTCVNCAQEILSTNFQLHEAHCFRNFRRCEHCGQLLPVAEIDAHVQERLGSLDLLSAALERGDAARVTSALAHDPDGAFLGWTDESGASLLHLAVARANDRWDVQALVEQLLRLGAPVAERDRLGWTPLHAAARAGAAAACVSLLAAGADVHARGGLGATPLEVCSGEEVRLTLLQAGADLMPSRGASRGMLKQL